MLAIQYSKQALQCNHKHQMHHTHLAGIMQIHTDTTDLHLTSLFQFHQKLIPKPLSDNILCFTNDLFSCHFADGNTLWHHRKSKLSCSSTYFDAIWAAHLIFGRIAFSGILNKPFTQPPIKIHSTDPIKSHMAFHGTSSQATSHINGNMTATRLLRIILKQHRFTTLITTKKHTAT